MSSNGHIEESITLNVLFLQVCVCHADVKTFCRKVEVAKDRIPGWPSERLTVLAEHSSTFYDLMSDSVVEQVRQSWC